MLTEPARALYTLLGMAIAPLLPLRLLWRGRREPGYRIGIGERFGRYTGAATGGKRIWLHAVSVGETRAALPFVNALKAAYPTATILLTHMTATGRETARALFGDGVEQAWLPYDLPFAVSGFLEHFHPVAGFLLETELWPNLAAHSAAAGVPLYLVNARMSRRSARAYAHVPSLTRPLLRRLAGIAAQSPDDATRLAALGASAPVVTGNIKFDISVPQEALAQGGELRARFGAMRPVWVAASTRDGEEAMILDALARTPLPIDTLLVIVPRHPQRFRAVGELLAARGVSFVRRSSAAPVPAGVGVVLGDSMGEMLAYYAASDLAFIGGSLLPLGGQNLIEALAAGVPVLVGPHTYNFSEAATGAVAAGAAQRVADADALVHTVGELFSDPARRDAMREAAGAFHAAHRGATQRLMHWLEPQLESALRR
jgi:3-deoxy-D-manno-octulosonic-acid transferase